MSQSLSLSFFEILSLVGLVQCIFLLVYIGSRMAKLGRIKISFFYLLSLGVAFFLDLGQRELSDFSPYYNDWQWFAWFIGPPLSVLVIIQSSDLNKKLTMREYWILLLVPLCYIVSISGAHNIVSCDPNETCEEMTILMNLTGLLAGAISLLVTFSYKGLFAKLQKQKFGKERYWLILSLITLNTLMLLSIIAALLEFITLKDAYLMRTILGLAFVYLMSTNLLRLYPKTNNNARSPTTSTDFTDAEKDLAQKIEHLIDVDKVYQEAAYSRADLARECGVSEVMVSKVLNAHFEKTFPQLMNEHRVEEAKKLLKETNATIYVIASEVGFNSLPSFNRVFKSLTNQSPTAYRRSIIS